MNKFRMLRAVNLSILPAAALSLAITFGAQGNPGKGLAASAKVPSPESCIKLLEDIMQRLHNMPTLAMKTAEKQQIAYQATSDNGPHEGPTNQLLAIKPKESNINSSFFANQATASARGSGASKAKKASKQAVLTSDAVDSLASAGNTQTHVNGSLIKGKFAQDTIAYQGGTNSDASYGSEGGYNTKFMQGANNLSSNTVNYGWGAKSANGPAKELKVTDERSYVRDYNDVLKPMAPAAGKKEARGVGGLGGVAYIGSQAMNNSVGGTNLATNAPVRDLKANNQSVPGRHYYKQSELGIPQPVTEESSAQAIAGGGGSRVWNRATSAPFVAQGFNASQQSGMTNVRGALQTASPRQTPAISQAAPADEENDSAISLPPLDPDSYKHFRVPFDGSKFPPAPIALLPPNVITGIPLIHLGSSALEASKALTPIGKVNKENIGSWTVWVFNRANSTEPAMQLYIRHGLVDALRVFDSSLIAPDFGVKLGDRLSVVKQRFGEPTFMVAEPNGGRERAQNYVYPISQVSFELARVNKNQYPTVVSILIFTVK